MTPNWHKSTYSGDNDNCVEAATNQPAVAMIRDTKHHGAGPVITVGAAAWGVFVQHTQHTG
ncbi:DUF397 domain-containing protein [Streptomyces sp. NPDC050703]|uniref:DUF397 domain-containing protein n=1 Tax=Streptomyces sp. NPDC050703 TaxID=3157218 RepID=UPI00342EDA52